ncbi:MAG: poly-gamma-glutamate biosynthesis protein PgsC/CapC, partial [Wenzhouxiangellaceae bacterium]|nr:poly-gamma-glutamate biosynthesis protein PgsC/CapC [Wenzhouxiangellaceae bacterium]
RKTALMILIGYLVGSIIDLSIGGSLSFQDGGATSGGVPGSAYSFLELRVVGYIIPGLIAIWFDRQGVLRTLTGLIVSAVLVRLILIVVMPDVLMSFEAQQALDRPEWSSIFGGADR